MLAQFVDCDDLRMIQGGQTPWPRLGGERVLRG